MNLRQLFLTKNECYIKGGTHTVKGIMVHSTAANNPKLSRYVGPDDGLLGPNPYNNHWNQARPGGRQICCHAFIGKLADGSIATYQTLPWDMPGWHSGTGSKGKAANANNTGYIGFEICEDDTNNKDYFNKVYKEAVELCVYLCKLYGLTEQNIIDHSEGHKLGIASNHGDVKHWFTKHGKTMDTFRADVKALLNQSTPAPQYKDGDKVTINQGAVYGGLSSTRGSKIPTSQLHPKQHTISRVQTNNGVQEALLREISSWVALSYLTPVNPPAPPSTDYKALYETAKKELDTLNVEYAKQAVELSQANNKIAELQGQINQLEAEKDGLIMKNTYLEKGNKELMDKVKELEKRPPVDIEDITIGQLISLIVDKILKKL